MAREKKKSGRTSPVNTCAIVAIALSNVMVAEPPKAPPPHERSLGWTQPTILSFASLPAP